MLDMLVVLDTLPHHGILSFLGVMCCVFTKNLNIFLCVELFYVYMYMQIMIFNGWDYLIVVWLNKPITKLKLLCIEEILSG